MRGVDPVHRPLGRVAAAMTALLLGALLQPPGPATAGSPESMAPSDSPAPLAGTRWQLVELQSMDDATGTTRVRNPALYTLHLQPDGRATMRLDCNRGFGEWRAEPSRDPSNGSFRFGPLAVTRALCPPPSLGERVAIQAASVRGYLLKDGRLHLSLLADGGILVWEPMASAEGDLRLRRDPALEQAIRRATPDYRRSVVGSGTGPARYVHFRVDLNRDGAEEVFAYPMGSTFCGTGGCNLLLFTPTEGGDLKLINDFPISRLPILLSTQRTQGWLDFWRPESGGGAPPTYVHHVFDGRRYIERERIPADPPPEGSPIPVRTPTFADGIPLDPSP